MNASSSSAFCATTWAGSLLVNSMLSNPVGMLVRRETEAVKVEFDLVDVRAFGVGWFARCRHPASGVPRLLVRRTTA